jgi:hypothetical protein
MSSKTGILSPSGLMSEVDYTRFCSPFFRVGQPFGTLERIVFEAEKGLADAFFNTTPRTAR